MKRPITTTTIGVRGCTAARMAAQPKKANGTLAFDRGMKYCMIRVHPQSLSSDSVSRVCSHNSSLKQITHHFLRMGERKCPNIISMLPPPQYRIKLRAGSFEKN